MNRIHFDLTDINNISNDNIILTLENIQITVDSHKLNENDILNDRRKVLKLFKADHKKTTHKEKYSYICWCAEQLLPYAKLEIVTIEQMGELDCPCCGQKYSTHLNELMNCYQDIKEFNNKLQGDEILLFFKDMYFNIYPEEKFYALFNMLHSVVNDPRHNKNGGEDES